MLQQLNRHARRMAGAGGAALLLLAACSDDPPDRTAALEALEAQFESSISLSPVTGFTAATAAEGGAASLADVEAARLARLQILNQLQAMDPDTLPAELQERFYEIHDRLVPVVELDRFGMANRTLPGPYLITDRDGAHVERIDGLLEARIVNRQDADAWLGDLADTATAIRTETQRFRVETRAGVTLPVSIAERAIADLDRQLDPAREPEVLRSFRLQLAQLTGIESYESTRLADEARTIYASDLAPALTELSEIFEAQRQSGHSDDGLWSQPDGEARYAALFAFYVAPGVAPEEISSRAETVLEETQLEVEALLTELGRTEGSVGERLAALSVESIEDEGAEGVDAASDPEPPLEATASMNARLNQRFDWARNNLAQMISAGAIRPLVVRAKEVHRHEPLWPVRYVAQGDPAASDMILFDPAVFARWPDWSLPALIYADGLPGRHLLASQRSFTHPTRNGASGGLSDGWSLYAAGLASDLGGYDDHRADRIGYFQFTMLATALAQADIGVHVERWSAEEAGDFIQSTTGLNREVVDSMVAEIVRHPARSVSAFAGNEALWSYRDRAATRLGSAFDLRRFHDVILAGGPRPFATVERDIESSLAGLETPPPAN